MKITKCISLSGDSIEIHAGAKIPLERFPRYGTGFSVGSLLYLKDDPRFFWLIDGFNEALLSDLVFCAELDVSPERPVPMSGFFVFRYETSRCINIQGLSRVSMWCYGDMAFLSDYIGCGTRGPMPTLLLERELSDIPRSSLFRLSGSIEEMALDGVSKIKQLSIEGRMIEDMFDDLHRGAFLGFEYSRAGRRGYVIRSVFEAASEVDFVLDESWLPTNCHVLSFF